jgi:hypothetical protein
MGKARRQTAATLAIAALFAVGAAADENGLGRTRVRSSDAFIAALIKLAEARSATFKRLLTALESTDGIVHVESGRCSHWARACLQIWMQAAGGNRYLRILVDPSRADSDADLAGSIGHELQHAIEALSDRTVVDGTTLYSFYRRYAPTGNDRFETSDALAVGDAIRYELRRR